MKHFEQFAALAARGHGEVGPGLDVTAGVRDDIRRHSQPRGADLALWLCSGLSLTAASVVLLLAVQSWSVAADPLAGLFDTLTMVMR